MPRWQEYAILRLNRVVIVTMIVTPGRAGDIRRLCAASDDPWTRCYVRAYPGLGQGIWEHGYALPSSCDRIGVRVIMTIYCDVCNKCRAIRAFQR